MKDELFDRLIKRTLECLAIDTVQSAPCELSPFGEGVGKCIKYTLDLAQKFGFTIFNNQGYYGVAEIGEGETFGILGHLDTVPYDNQWKHNPLGEICDNKIYGRGILDDKGPMLACLFAVYCLLLEGKTPKKTIRFIFGGNEESGWGCIDKYLECDVMPKLGFSPDGDFPVINCEKGIVHYTLSFAKPSELISLDGGSRVNVVMEECFAKLSAKLNSRHYNKAYPKLRFTRRGDITSISSFGKSAHGSHPEKGDNAFINMAKALAEEFGQQSLYATLYEKFSDINGKNVGLDLSDEKSGNLTLNVGLAYIKDDKLCIELDIRFPVSYKETEIKQAIVANLGDILINIEKTGGHDPLYVDENDELVQALLSSYNMVTGEKAKPIAIGGGTYARAMPHGVAFGPVFPQMESTIHERDEYVNIDDFRKMATIYYEAIKQLCF